MWPIVRQLPMKAGWWDTSLALLDLAEAMPIISDNVLPLLTEKIFQTPHSNPPLLFGPACLFIFTLSARPPLPPFIKIPYYLELQSMCLTQNKRNALNLTLNGIVSLIKLLLNKDFNYVLPRSFQSDRFEEEYGNYCQSLGGY